MEQLLTYIEVHPLRTLAITVFFLLMCAAAIVRLGVLNEKFTKVQYYGAMALTFLVVVMCYIIAIQMNLNLMQ